MQWLNTAVDELLIRHPDGDIVVSSGVSPSGVYHLGTLREVLTAEAIAREVRRRGRTARHLHVSDDLDIFRKVPAGIPEDFKRHLGRPLCDIPAPDESDQSYADYYLNDLTLAAEEMHMDITIIRAHQKYREGFFSTSIEQAFDQREQIKQILEEVSGHKVDEAWSPIQVVEDGFLKNRQLVDIDKDSKLLSYLGRDGAEKQVNYAEGNAKLNWRVDWPARWSLLGVQAEPFGRDHATKGGSYDTGKVIVKEIFAAEPPLPLPYDFINQTGQTKKMSKSAGDTITAAQLLKMLPPEVVWFFILRYAPSKLLFFDAGPSLIKLVDEFSELLAKADKTPLEQQLIDLSMHGVERQTVSRVPFSHLVSSYQAALRGQQRTIDIIARSEYAEVAKDDADIIKTELAFIDAWLDHSAPEEVKFALLDSADESEFSDAQRAYLAALADQIEHAPADADGSWFHQTIYSHKETADLEPKQLFTTLYQAIIGKDSGPRAGWFLSILPRNWLIKRLRFEG